VPKKTDADFSCKIFGARRHGLTQATVKGYSREFNVADD
jgi:hypothetical protein